MKVLIVDDSSIMRTILEKFLRKYDLDIVGQAENGMKAIEMFKEHSPDLITMDLTMPELDGITAIKRILESEPKAKIVVVTAQSDEATAIRAMKAGATAFLGKPFNEEKFDAVLKKVIEKLG